MPIGKDEVFWQLDRAGYTPLMESWHVGSDNTLIGKASSEFLKKLRADDRFACGIFYGLHRDVGTHLQDFRAYHGRLGPGSLQIVIDTMTFRLYADIDRNNPYHDLVRFFAHSGEVVGHFFRKWFRRR